MTDYIPYHLIASLDRRADGGSAGVFSLQIDIRLPCWKEHPAHWVGATGRRVEPVQYGCAKPPDCRRRVFTAARRPRPPSPAQRLSRGRTGCEVSEAGACAVGRGARGGGFITTS